MVVKLMQFLLQIPEVVKADLHREHNPSLPGATAGSNSLVKLLGQTVLGHWD